MNKTYFLKKWLSKVGALPVSAVDPRGEVLQLTAFPMRAYSVLPGLEIFFSSAEGRAGAAAHTLWALTPLPTSLSELLGCTDGTRCPAWGKKPSHPMHLSREYIMNWRAVLPALGQQTMPFSLPHSAKQAVRLCLKWTMCWRVFLTDSSLQLQDQQSTFCHPAAQRGVLGSGEQRLH